MTAEFITGIVVVVVIAIAVWLSGRKADKNRHYDEMQLKLRADGYRIGFFVTLAGLLIQIFFFDGGLDRWIDPALGMFIVMMAGIVTFAVYCIIKEAFFSIGDKGKSYLLLCLAICLGDGALAITRIVDGTLWEGGRITFQHGSTLVVSLSFLAILIAFVIKKAQLKKEVAE